jgi:hypothetical protein
VECSGSPGLPPWGAWVVGPQWGVQWGVGGPLVGTWVGVCPRRCGHPLLCRCPHPQWVVHDQVSICFQNR